MRRLHRVQSPDDQSETGNGAIEGLGIAVFVGHSLPSIEGELIDDDQISNASPCIPAPCLCLVMAEGSKETRQDHDDIGSNGNQNIGTTKTGQESQIQQEKRGCDGPVNISCPVDFTVDHLVCVWHLLVRLSHGIFGIAESASSRHGEVGQKGEGGDEGSQDMEQPFLLQLVSKGGSGLLGSLNIPQARGKPCHRRRAMKGPSEPLRPCHFVSNCTRLMRTT